MEEQDFADTRRPCEDDEILAQLTDPLDVEAFANMMEYAHAQGKSAASMVREEPGVTSRKAIRRLCLKDKKKVLRDRVRDVLRRMGWTRCSPNDMSQGSPCRR